MGDHNFGVYIPSSSGQRRDGAIVTRGDRQNLAASGIVTTVAPVRVRRMDRKGEDRNAAGDYRIDCGSRALFARNNPSGFAIQSADADAAGPTGSWIRIPGGSSRFDWDNETKAWTFRGNTLFQGVDGLALMLSSGRLFWSVQLGLTVPRIELVDWESEAPFWIAKPDADGWLLEPTVAGCGLEDRESLLVPWVLAIVEADQKTGDT